MARHIDPATTIEDLTFLADNRVGATSAAHRLGFPTLEALEKWLAGQNRRDLYALLRSYDPLTIARAS